MLEKDRKYIEGKLNFIIRESLWAPGGDPDSCNLWAAAGAVWVLDKLGMVVEDREMVESTLRGENIYDEDFLKWG